MRARDEVVAAARERTHAVDRVGGLVPDHDHRQVRERVEHIGVAEQHEVRPRALGELERGAAVAGAEDVEAVVREMALEEAAHVGGGLGDQECGRHAHEASAGAAT